MVTEFACLAEQWERGNGVSSPLLFHPDGHREAAQAGNYGQFG
jgi:hypothetical protein